MWKDFINVDIKVPHKEGYLWCESDITKLDWIPDNFVQEVTCIHVIEHIPRWKTEWALKEWYRVLDKNGLLVIECPDLNKIIDCFNSYSWSCDKKLPDGRTVNILSDCMAGLYGDQKSKDPAMEHKWCFRPLEMFELLKSVGFDEVVVYAEPKFHRPFRDMRIEVRK